jgi:hypothetical protein
VTTPAGPPRRAPRPRPRRVELLVCVVWALVFGAGPTVGDVGSCSDPVTPLDEAAFAAERKEADCQMCTACGLTTQTCANACNPKAPPDTVFPPTCRPLAHDGVVCIDALLAASCSAYAGYVSDTDPTEPPECEFCQDVPEAGALEGDL